MDKKSTNATGTAGADSVQSVSSEPNTTTANPAAAVETTNVAAVETIPATDAATGAPVDTVVIVKPPKKKKTGLIVGIIIAALLVLGGVGAAIWYFAVYQSPENVVFDAMNNFLSAQHVQTEGEFTYHVVDEDTENSFLYTLKLENKSNTLPNATNLNLSIRKTDSSDETSTLSVDLGTAIMSDGVIYFQISNLIATLEELSVDSSEFDNDFAVAIYDIIEIVDGEWWRISIPEIIDELDLGDDARQLKNLYSCVIESAKKDHTGELAALYREHPFASIEKATDETAVAGSTAYDATLNYDQLADFFNELPDTSSSTDIMACYNTYAEATGGEKISPEDATEISADDIREALPEEYELGFVITNGSHELTHITFSTIKNDQEWLAAQFSFTYEPADVTVPAEYRPITELFEEIAEIIAELFANEEELPELPDFELPVEIGV